MVMYTKTSVVTNTYNVNVIFYLIQASEFMTEIKANKARHHAADDDQETGRYQ